MRFNKILSLTRKGETLTDKQIDSLACHLKLKFSTFNLLLKSIISIVVLSITVYCFIKIDKLIVNMIILSISIILILLIFLIKNNTKKIILYLDALKEFSLKKYSEFEGIELLLVQHQFQKNGYLQNDLAIIIADKYDFYIFDDFLKETKYLLPNKFKSNINKQPALKVINPEFVNKRPVHFKLDEIAYYSLVKPFNQSKKIKVNLGSDYYRYTFTPLKFELDNYCMLVLEDGSTFKLGEETITLLRKKAIAKERN